MSVICLVDCDSFYVSCEQKDHPIYKGKPVCVLTGAGLRGIIVSRSKEAKALGVPMGVPLFQLKNKFPDLICLPAHMDRYQEYSNAVMRCLRTFTPDIEVVSVDEAYMNLTGLNKTFSLSYEALVRRIRQTIFKTIGIPVSIGLSTSKTLAKLASDQAKTHQGIYAISPKKVTQQIGNMTIDTVCGIGKSTARQLKTNGIFTVQDFITQSDARIRQLTGKNGLFLKYELKGLSVSEVNPVPEPPQSIQDSAVIGDFSSDYTHLLSELKKHIHQACKKLRGYGGFCQEVGLFVRTKEFRYFQELQRLNCLTNNEAHIFSVAKGLLDTVYQPDILYRSIGIGLFRLTYEPPAQGDLFNPTPCEEDKLSAAIDVLEQKFGDRIVTSGVEFADQKKHQHIPRIKT